MYHDLAAGNSGPRLDDNWANDPRFCGLAPLPPAPQKAKPKAIPCTTPGYNGRTSLTCQCRKCEKLYLDVVEEEIAMYESEWKQDQEDRYL